jgi:hypothetical protein
MTTNPPAQGQGGSDALAQLEALLQKTKASKGQAPSSGLGGLGGDDLVGGLSGGVNPDIEAEAEKLAREQAEKEEQFRIRMEESEAERQRALAEQQSKMAELSNTPQYQARVQQTEEAHQHDEEQKAAIDGHEIRQVTTTKL